MKARKAILLVGSPKGRNSASYNLASYLLNELQLKGFAHKCFFARDLEKTEDFDRFYSALLDSSLLLVVFPLYVDQLPASLISVLKEIRSRSRGFAELSDKQLVAIINCGFPETRQTDPAVAIMKIFSDQCGFQWAGALALGMGAMLSKRKPSDHDHMTRHIAASLKAAAVHLENHKPIPVSVIEMIAKPLMPHWLYIMVGNLGWKYRAKKNRVRSLLTDRPFQP